VRPDGFNFMHLGGLMDRDAALRLLTMRGWLSLRTWRPHPEEPAVGGRLEGWVAATSRIRPSIPAAWSTPECCKHVVPQTKEGAGKAGCPLHPQPRMQNEKAYEQVHHRYAGSRRPSLRNGFTAYSALSSETWLCCLRHRRDAKHRRQLDTCLGVSGPHGFADSEQCHSSDDMPRPSHPALNVRDDAQRPSDRGGMGAKCHCIDM